MITYHIEHDDDPIPPWEDDDCVIFRLEAGNYLHIVTDKNKPIPADWTEHAVFAYIHGGIALSLKPFACSLHRRCVGDSGHVGFIYTSPDITKPQGIIDELNMYLAGDVWGYIVEQDGEHVESCWGFYGHDNCEEEAQSVLNHFRREAMKRKQHKLKQYIRHHVPLEARV